MPFRSLTATTLATSLLAFASSAAAQHANFVLFGEPNPDARLVSETHRFVHPVTGPFFHEDSFVTSDVRLIYLHHAFPDDSIVANTGAVAAVQLRLALTDQLQFVAYRDGYTWLDGDGKLPTPNQENSIFDGDGFQDVALGLKWNFYQDWGNQLHVAAGVGYQFPWGDHLTDEVGAGINLGNKSEFRYWLSVNKGFDRLHLGAVINAFYAREKTKNQSGHHGSLHLHADYYVNKFFSPLIEINSYLSFEDRGHPAFDGIGGNFPLEYRFGGADITNLGNGDLLITGALGGEFRLTDNFALRAAYERALTQEESLFGWRITLSAVFSF